MSWPVLQICSVKLGGSGKHRYDITYHEVYMDNWVSKDCSRLSVMLTILVQLDPKLLQNLLFRCPGMFSGSLATAQ